MFSSIDARQAHELQLHFVSISESSDSVERAAAADSNQSFTPEDRIFNYYSNFMKMALLERNFQDTVGEMDGERLYRLWKFKMLHLRRLAEQSMA